jgi:hypothetical protein
VKVLDEYKIALLKRALRLIEEEKEHYICYALSSAEDTEKWVTSRTVEPSLVGVRHVMIREASLQLRKYVSRRLGSHARYQNWLNRESLEYRALWTEAERRKAAREGRVAWIKHMIALLES